MSNEQMGSVVRLIYISLYKATSCGKESLSLALTRLVSKVPEFMANAKGLKAVGSELKLTKSEKKRVCAAGEAALTPQKKAHAYGCMHMHIHTHTPAMYTHMQYLGRQEPGR